MGRKEREREREGGAVGGGSGPEESVTVERGYWKADD